MNGIELYSLSSKEFIPFIKPDDSNVRYLFPVVTKSGIGFCIKEMYPLEVEKRSSRLVEFDLLTMKINRVYPTKIFNKFANLSLSMDQKRLAYISSSDILNKNDKKVYLVLFNTVTKTTEKKIPIERQLLDKPIRLTWRPDNTSIIVWDTLMNKQKVLVNTKTGKVSEIDMPYYPLAYSEDKQIAELAWDGNLLSLYVAHPENEKKKLAGEAHNARFSSDGKYIVIASLTPIGETLQIFDKENAEKRFEIKLHDFGTVLGMDIW